MPAPAQPSPNPTESNVPAAAQASASADDLRPIVILGPTAGGKTALSVGLGEQLNGEIIGADSMQVYKHMDAGTAKPSHEDRRRVPHHVFDIVEPTERFTVHDWLQAAQTAVQDIQSRGKRPILVGGTNLYIKAFLEGLMDGPGQDPEYRQTLEQKTETELHAMLAEVDPAAAERIHLNDRKRLTRALEVFHLSGKPISQWQTQWEAGMPNDGLRLSKDASENPSDPNHANQDDAQGQSKFENRKSPILIGLRWPVELINPRINLRVKAMFYPEKVDPQLAADVCINGENLLDETKRLEAAGLLGEQAREALGYKQVLNFVHGQWDEETAFERTKILTRRFAKQQRTWLKRFSNVLWIDMPCDAPTAQAVAMIRENGGQTETKPDPSPVSH